MLTSEWGCISIPPHAFLAHVREFTRCLWRMIADTNEEKWVECWAEGRGQPVSWHLRRRFSQLQVICEHIVDCVVNLFLFCSSVYERCYKYHRFLKVGISSNDFDKNNRV